MALDRAWYNTLADDSGGGTDGSVWDKADVDALMDAIDAEIGAGGWTAYTPTWGSTGSGNVLGNSTITGKWVRVGHTVTFKLRFMLGTTGSADTSAYLFSLPSTPLAADDVFPVFLNDASVGQYVAVAHIFSGANVLIIAAGAPNGLSSTTPFQWVPGDSIEISGQYEVA